MSEESNAAAVQKIDLPVDKEWLVNVINERCSAEGVLISYQCDRIGEGKGFLSRVTRVRLNWDPESSEHKDLPAAVVIKKPTVDIIHEVDETTKLCITFEDLVRSHNQECKVYEFIAKHPDFPIPTAKHFYHEPMSVDDKESGIIILEDLSDKAVSLELFEDANVQKILNLSEYIARLQAFGFKHADELDDYFGSRADGFYNQDLNILEGKLVELRSQVGDKRMRLSNKQILHMAVNAKAKMKIFQDPTPYGYTKVLNLGDAQPNNILWAKTSEGKPSDEIAAFLDFQLSHMGNCMNDIQLALNYCLSTEDRRRYQDHIMNHYLATLNSQLTRDGTAQLPISKVETEEVTKILTAQLVCVWLGYMPGLNTWIEVAKVDKSNYDKFFNKVIDLLMEVYPTFASGGK